MPEILHKLSWTHIKSYIDSKLVAHKLGIVRNAKYFVRCGVHLGKGSNIQGDVKLQLRQGGYMSIGYNFTCQSGLMTNPLGANLNSFFRVGEHGVLNIGDHVGMSSSSIWCNQSITIGNNVKIGAGCIICDTDCHSLDPLLRLDPKTDACNAKCAPIEIKDSSFIGARSIICKGVTVGANSIVGIGSVVTKSIPDNEIWAGNLAKFIRKIETSEQEN